MRTYAQLDTRCLFPLYDILRINILKEKGRQILIETYNRSCKQGLILFDPDTSVPKISSFGSIQKCDIPFAQDLLSWREKTAKEFDCCTHCIISTQDLTSILKFKAIGPKIQTKLKPNILLELYKLLNDHLDETKGYINVPYNGQNIIESNLGKRKIFPEEKQLPNIKISAHSLVNPLCISTKAEYEVPLSPINESILTTKKADPDCKLGVINDLVKSEECAFIHSKGKSIEFVDISLNSEVVACEEKFYSQASNDFPPMKISKKEDTIINYHSEKKSNQSAKIQSKSFRNKKGNIGFFKNK